MAPGGDRDFVRGTQERALARLEWATVNDAQTKREKTMQYFGCITKETYDLLESDPNRSDVSEHDRAVYEILKVRERRLDEAAKAVAELLQNALFPKQ